MGARVTPVLIMMDHSKNSVFACVVHGCSDGLNLDECQSLKMRKSKVNTCDCLWYIANINIVSQWRTGLNVLFSH